MLPLSGLVVVFQLEGLLLSLVISAVLRSISLLCIFCCIEWSCMPPDSWLMRVLFLPYCKISLLKGCEIQPSNLLERDNVGCCPFSLFFVMCNNPFKKYLHIPFNELRLLCFLCQYFLSTCAMESCALYSITA